MSTLSRQRSKEDKVNARFDPSRLADRQWWTVGESRWKTTRGSWRCNGAKSRRISREVAPHPQTFFRTLFPVNPQRLPRVSGIQRNWSRANRAIRFYDDRRVPADGDTATVYASAPFLFTSSLVEGSQNKENCSHFDRQKLEKGLLVTRGCQKLCKTKGNIPGHLL